MSWSAGLVAVLLLGSVGYLSLAGFVWSKRGVAGRRPLFTMLLAVKVWTLCYALELSSRSVESAQLWAALKFIGVVALPPALWAFVLDWTGRGRMSRRTLGVLLVEPVVVLCMLAVPATHDLIHYYPQPPEPLRRVLGSPAAENGDLFWLHAGYTYLLMMGAVAVLCWHLVRIARPYRRQGLAMAGASLLPFLGNVLWNAGLIEGDPVDPTPLLFSVTAAVLVWGFYRLRLLDLAPVARGVLIEQMGDGVMLLDVRDRVVDVNPAGADLVGAPARDLVGRSAEDVLPGIEPVLSSTRGDHRVDSELTVEPHDAGGRVLAVSVTRVTDPVGRHVARLVLLRDVTAVKRAEDQLRTLLDAQTRLSGTLRESLLPISLPRLPCGRLASRSEPSPRGDGGVGGDFYDVHPAGHGRSAFVLGDVSGKGVHAAIVTSMARYTLRTLSAQGWSPRQVLSQLNRGLLTLDDEERYCTVVYGQTWRTGPSDGRAPVVRVVLSLGGHPPPLLHRRRDRTVIQVGAPGTALGLVEAVDLREVTVDLEAGDVLLAYTDGVTEARRGGGEQFGDERLAQVLAAAAKEHDDPCAGAEAGAGADHHAESWAQRLVDAVADAVVSTVKQFANDRDDVAVLVLAAE